jgi:hypothetical protein
MVGRQHRVDALLRTVPTRQAEALEEQFIAPMSRDFQMVTLAEGQ